MDIQEIHISGRGGRMRLEFWDRWKNFAMERKKEKYRKMGYFTKKYRKFVEL